MRSLRRVGIGALLALHTAPDAVGHLPRDVAGRARAAGSAGRFAQTRPRRQRGGMRAARKASAEVTPKPRAELPAPPRPRSTAPPGPEARRQVRSSLNLATAHSAVPGFGFMASRHCYRLRRRRRRPWALGDTAIGRRTQTIYTHGGLPRSSRQGVQWRRTRLPMALGPLSRFSHKETGQFQSRCIQLRSGPAGIPALE